ncbi:DUF3772 domain-containing protein [Salipiger sp. IMCC34102]|uniref:DUF3772 domain-containing protein n=1 Tax=Salipiger sp. IMCC34102 TaxID=2510647 RepID=UPI00101D104F|nr:DUF3772 domain-containing protein [Salipiger sp. IMCC34102]RYH03286.1 DUF3772 domain-containing protein [Salipiger sp. IMCC34102]
MTRILAVLLCLLFGFQASAQVGLDALTGGSESAAEEEAASADAVDPDPGALNDAEAALADRTGPLSDWRDLAAMAEETLATEASVPTLQALRTRLFDWRARFMAYSNLNTGRISTLRAQIAALTPATEGAEVPPAIAARMEEVRAQLDALQAPAMLASEAYARANGLIAEIDRTLRAADTRRLTVRASSPLNPDNWAAATEAVSTSMRQVGDRLYAQVTDAEVTGNLWQTVPLGLLALAAALLLLVRSPRWLSLAQTKVEASQARGRALWATLLSALQLLLPLLGMSALFIALRQFGVLPRTGQALLAALYNAGVIVIVARWLNLNLFPKDATRGPLGYDAENRHKFRHAGIGLGVMVAIVLVVNAMLRDVGAATIAISVVSLPVLIVTCLPLWRMGWLLRHAPVGGEAQEGPGRKRIIVGQLCTLVAVAAPILAALGFADATRALFSPTVMTLAILGGFVVMQRLVTRLFAPADPAEETSSLVPILVGVMLFIALIPVTALVWGASTADLIEVWTRFRAGFRIGEATISPTDFLTFAAVFAIGYIATRVLQRSLRTTVLPRTRLDLGGQNAVVSGLGYIGITLAALLAITLAGINLSSLAIVAGALSVGIGFGLQTIVSNFVSGIILLIERPIGEGDMIEVNGQVGYVRDISVRATRIETFDRTDVIIPNADLVSGQVTNWTRGNLVGRLILPVSVAYGSDVAAVKEILLEVADDNPMVIADPAPQALFMAFGASSLDFELRVILRDVNWKVIVIDEMNSLIERRLDAAGIEVPFPQTDIWIRSRDAAGTASDEGAPVRQRPDEPQSMLTAEDLEDGTPEGEGDADAGATAS